MSENIKSKIEGLNLIEDFIKIKNFTRELKNRTNLTIDIDYSLNEENLNNCLKEIFEVKCLEKSYSSLDSNIKLNIIEDYDVILPIYNIDKVLVNILNINLDKISVYDKENNEKCIFEKIIIKEVNF